MPDALLYLRLTSLRNMVMSRVKRLRQPKYLVGAVVGIAYFWFFFFHETAVAARRAAPAGHTPSGQLPPIALELMPLALPLAGLVFLIIIVLMWLIPSGPASLAFSEAEIAFLFPAPMARRTLVHYKLAGSQFRSLFGAVIMTVFSSRWTWLGGDPVTHALGWWFIFSAINLHLTGSRFALARLGRAGRRRVLIAVLLAATVWAAVINLPPTPLRPDPLVISRWLAQLAGTAPLAWLLWPVKLVLAPFFAATLPAFLLTLAPALLVLVAHYLWVVQTAVSFEEASIAKAEKRAAALAARRAGTRRFGFDAPKFARRPPFRLTGAGRPELAFLWKNLLSCPGWINPRVLGVATAIVLLGGSWLRHHAAWHAVTAGVGVTAAIFSGYVLLIGPQFARQDIRHDLANTDILKTYPLAGWQVILGELLTPTAILTGLMWLLLLLAALTLYPRHDEFPWLAPTGRPLAAACLALLIPPLVLLQLLVPNTATLLFPAWFHSSHQGEHGIEIMGQRLLFFFAQLILIIVTLAPALLVAGAGAHLVKWLLGPAPALVAATVLALAALVAEAAGALWWLGRRFQRFDLSSELRP